MIFEILSLVTATNLSIFAIVLLFIKSQRHDSRNLLSLLFFCLAINLAEVYVIHSGLYHQFPYVLKLSLVSSSLTGMAFYHYIISILGPRFRVNKRSIVHFLPAIITFVIYVVFQLKNHNYKVAYYDELAHKMSILEIGINLSINLLTIAYFIATYRVLVRLKRCLVNNFSGPDQVAIQWLIYFVLGLIISMTAVVLILLLIQDEEVLERLGIVIMSSIYLVSLIRTIIKPALITDFKFISDSHCLALSKDHLCIVKNKNEKDDVRFTFNKLKDFIEKEKIYCVPKLSLDQLADKMGIKKYLLSQAINKHAQQNYFTFINSYRIEEAKRKLSDELYKDCSVESIGLSCGFNSSSSFFLVFKRIVGETPKEYRKKSEELGYVVRL